MAKKVRKFVDPNDIGTRRPEGSTGTSVYAGMKDADWNCNSCGKKNIVATTKICPNCNHPKDSSEGYHSPASERSYLTEKDMAERGIDMERQKDEECPFCGSALTSKTQVCSNCGANLENVYKTDRVCPACQRETNEKNCPACGTETVTKKSLAAQSHYSSASSYRPAEQPIQTLSQVKPYLLYAGIGLLVLICIAVMIVVFRPHDELATVNANSWSCSVSRQEYQYNAHGDWTLPPNADLIKSYEKFHHNKQVEDGKKEVCELKWEVVGSHEVPTTKEVCTKGEYIDTTEVCDDETNVCTYTKNYEPDTCENVPDGGSETVKDYDWVNRCEDVMQYKDEPVNQTYYEYNIWEWIGIPAAETSGTNNIIACPVVTDTQTIRKTGNPVISCATEFLVGEKLYPYSPDCSIQFPLFNPGSAWQVTISGPSIIEVQYAP